MAKPRLIVVCGLPGTGKSTVAEGISKHLKMALFSVDPIESAILKAGVPKSFETGLAAYLVAEKLADEQLKLGHSVIIDSVSAQKEAKQIWRDLARSSRTDVVVIECLCSDTSLHKRRIASRVRGMHGIPEVTWEDVENRRREYLVWDEDKLALDAVDAPEANIAKAIQYVED